MYRLSISVDILEEALKAVSRICLFEGHTYKLEAEIYYLAPFIRDSASLELYHAGDRLDITLLSTDNH